MANTGNAPNDVYKIFDVANEVIGRHKGTLDVLSKLNHMSLKKSDRIPTLASNMSISQKEIINVGLEHYIRRNYPENNRPSI